MGETPPARGRVVHPIEARSYAIMATRVDLTRWPPGARDVVARMVHATADESFASSARVGTSAVAAALEALRRRAVVVCDSNMVLAGVAGVAGAVCYLGRVPPPTAGTRSAAAVEAAGREHPRGALWVFGNAPTALDRLLRMHEAGLVAPAAVVGLPVGYVGAAEAKQALWESALRDLSITNEGPRGGSPAAAAALNALARLAGV